MLMETGSFDNKYLPRIFSHGVLLKSNNRFLSMALPARCDNNLTMIKVVKVLY